MDDLISRQEAIKVADKQCLEFRGIFSRIKEGLEELPSADVRENKHGEWHEADGENGFYGIYVCDQCGKFALSPTDFCPNCGCRMEEGDSDG